MTSATDSDVVQTMVDERVHAPEASARPTPATPPPTVHVAPVRPEERIQSVDVLRGVALLGILFLNIDAFGLPYAAYSDPSVYGGAGGLNLATWLISHLLFEGKMRAIFSMLFGASVIIMTSRAEKRGAGLELADIYYRRTLWLVAFGVLHGYLIWSGDILYHYGVVGLALFPLRKLSGRTLCVIGGVILAFHSMQGLRGVYRFSHMSRALAEYEASINSGQAPGDEQRLELEDADMTRKDFKPDAKALEKEIKITRSGYVANLIARARTTGSRQSDTFYRFLFWDISGMLILGMGLMKLGVFDASRSFRFYLWMALVGYGIGLPLDFAMSALWWRSHFDWVAMFRYMRVPADFVRFSIAAGHVAVVMMICKSRALPTMTKALSNVGRMALSNYLFTSVLCTLFFYGYGLGMFAKLQRFQLLYVLAAVWAINFMFSAVWLKFFRFGPLEWLWRSLSYAKIQPMRV